MTNPNHTPLVSVGIPTYNRAESLKKTITSVINQTYSNLEIIISDNASTDSTQQVCEAFCQLDPRITYIPQPKNFGAGNNFRFVLEKAQGEYFMWLGDDDYISEQYIARCIETFKSDVELVLVAGTARLSFGDQSDYIQRTQQGFKNNLRTQRFITYYKTVSDNSIFYGLIRNSNLSKVRISNRLAGDWFMISSLAFQGKLDVISDVYIYRNQREFDSFESLVQRLGLPWYQGKFPTFFIMLGAIEDIFKNEVYYEASYSEKFYLVSCLSILFISHMIWTSILYVLVSRTPKFLYPSFQKIYRFVIKHS